MTDASLFPLTPNFRVLVEQELMLVTDVSSNTLTVIREIEGTTAVAHVDNQKITHILTAAVATRFGQYFLLSGRTTNNTATEIFLDGVSNSRLLVPSDSAWMFTVLTVAKNEDTNETGGWYHAGCIEHNSTTTDIVGTVGQLFNQEDAALTVAITADDTNDALIITVTGTSSNNWQWRSKVFWTEITA
ncbi:MAG: hypothetical protein KGZ39_05590 [Simkania sp.]|nr:hypothetical protein [Simkania sp.]